ncbi:MAG: putative peptidoglycan glycosyltransferase FtsW, partial [Victivallales bacterium]|nr:putative peptidoglycan glycosyltransferase FtsW [Victivallales bacterium]
RRKMRSLKTQFQEPVGNNADNGEASLNYAIMLFVIVSTIVLFGLTALYSTSYGVAGATFFKKQLLWCGIGTGCGIVTFLIGYKRLVQWSPFFIVISIILLGVALCFSEVKGARRWIKIANFASIQPSEFAKVAIALFLARYCSDKVRNISVLSYKNGFLPGVAVCGVVMLMVLAGKDLGTTLLLGMVTAIVFFAAGLKMRYLVVPAVTLPPLLTLAIYKLDPMRWARITSFLDPETCLKEDGYQLWNSLLALGSGDWLGVGFMASRLKHKYLPEAHTDFILSIVGEELGLVGLCCVIIAYLALMFVAVKISINASTRQGMLLGCGITALISLQAFINMGVISGALPTKGMPAPFISYGGSNLVVCLIETGLLLSIALETAKPDFNLELMRESKEFLVRLWNRWI